MTVLNVHQIIDYSYVLTWHNPYKNGLVQVFLCRYSKVFP